MPFGGKVVHTQRKVVFDFEDFWFKTFRVITILNGVLGGGWCGCSRSHRRGCWRWSLGMPFGGEVVHTPRKVVFDFEDFWFKTFRVIMILNGVLGSGSCGCSRSRRWGCWRWSSVMPFGGMVVHHLRKIMINFEDFWFKTF